MDADLKILEKVAAKINIEQLPPTNIKILPPNTYQPIHSSSTTNPLIFHPYANAAKTAVAIAKTRNAISIKEVARIHAAVNVAHTRTLISAAHQRSKSASIKQSSVIHPYLNTNSNERYSDNYRNSNSNHRYYDRYQYPSSMERKRSRKIRATHVSQLRCAANETWIDCSMTDWPENDYRIFCGDLGNEVSDAMLTSAFSKYPSFAKAKVIRDKRTGKSKGYGFVSFLLANDFIRAFKEMNGKYVGNRPIKLRRSTWDQRKKKVKNFKIRQ